MFYFTYNHGLTYLLTYLRTAAYHAGNRPWHVYLFTGSLKTVYE